MRWELVTPVHEREHTELVRSVLAEKPRELLDRWDRGAALLDAARLYDAYLEFGALLTSFSRDPWARTHVQLQLLRCLRDAPVERLEAELELVQPQDEYQEMVLAFRTGWMRLHRTSQPEEAIERFAHARTLSRALSNRSWECAALLQTAHAHAQMNQHDLAVKGYANVYNLSRRNGLVEFIPSALRGKGYTLVRKGDRAAGEAALQKAYALACKNGLVGQQAAILHALANVYHYFFRFYGLAMEYYEQARQLYRETTVWSTSAEQLEKDFAACQQTLEGLDIAKILGPVPLQRLRQEYLTRLVNGFVGIPGIENRAQLGERIGLTRQAIYRNINA